jgi:hypothetical protein
MKVRLSRCCREATGTQKPLAHDAARRRMTPRVNAICGAVLPLVNMREIF